MCEAATRRVQNQQVGSTANSTRQLFDLSTIFRFVFLAKIKSNA